MIDEKRLQELESAWQIAGKMGAVPIRGIDLKMIVETIRELQDEIELLGLELIESKIYGTKQ